MLYSATNNLPGLENEDGSNGLKAPIAPSWLKTEHKNNKTSSVKAITRFARFIVFG